MPEGWQPRGVTPHPRSGAEAERSYPESEVRGGGWEELQHAPTPKTRGGSREELPLAQGQGQQLGAANPRPSPGAATGRSNPTSKERWLRGCRRA